jgi:hypothetical protein
VKKKRKYIQACNVGGSIYGKKRNTKKRTTISSKQVSKKDLAEVYNKFFKDQVAALYRAIHHN